MAQVRSISSDEHIQHSSEVLIAREHDNSRILFRSSIKRLNVILQAKKKWIYTSLCVCAAIEKNYEIEHAGGT